MAELKTKVTTASVADFIKKVPEEQKRKDALALLKVFKEATREKPQMWGAAMIGFGSYHYKSEKSAQEGDWPLTAFSPRKQNLTLYIMSGFSDLTALLGKLGKHKTSSGSCLSIHKLEDVNLAVLTRIIKKSVATMKKRYTV